MGCSAFGPVEAKPISHVSSLRPVAHFRLATLKRSTTCGASSNMDNPSDRH